jgi:hypothetical protein
MLSNGEATGFATVSDGFERWVSDQELDAHAQGLLHEGGGYFHCGSAFYGFETQLLMSLKHLERVEYVDSLPR